MGIQRIYSSGFKSISFIDVHASTSFTLWLCGCNLRCPFCHNWRLAIGDREICRFVSVEDIVESLISVSKLVDYLHVTGGEPLLQYKALANLLNMASEVGVRTSVNTNLTLPDNLDYLISNSRVDHVAADIKIPFKELSGLGNGEADNMVERIIDSLEIIRDNGIPLEIRIPVARGLTPKYLVEEMELYKGVLRGMEKLYCIVNPLVGEPVTHPRDSEWSKRYTNPSQEEINEVARSIHKLLGCRIYVKKWF